MILKTCIDFNEKFIKIIEGFEKKSNLYITNIGKIESPIEDLKKITSEDVEILGNFLIDYFKKNKFKGKFGIFTVNDVDTIYHYFELPNLPENEIENAIKYEGVQLIPDFIENYEYDYISFHINNKRNITLIAYPKNKVDLYCQILTKVKLKPIIMDVAGIALLNSFLYFNQTKDIVCFLNFGFSITNCVIYLKDKFLFLRDIPVGLKNLKDKELIEEQINELSEEINISIKYFQNKVGIPVKKIYLTGLENQIPEIKEKIERNLELLCEYYNPFFYLPENAILSEIKKEGSFYSTCFGLLTRKII
ncbi:MAG: pilus assembly protein PilM [Candidatus Omnitrophica bacterium]|nr:pilus assembly protein PilM [Candidatus Omnitrophota bacterium]MCM8807221.1 pilus assembly protein PilM [Candidatus Omnitrophota bacterium]